jgi:hypothetical protein
MKSVSIIVFDATKVLDCARDARRANALPFAVAIELMQRMMCATAAIDFSDC